MEIGDWQQLSVDIDKALSEHKPSQEQENEDGR